MIFLLLYFQRTGQLGIERKKQFPLMYEIWRSKKENLNVMYRLTFADAGVTGPIFKCQPATYCCWETSCCILLSFYSVCSLSPGIFYNVSLSLMGGHLSAFKAQQ